MSGSKCSVISSVRATRTGRHPSASSHSSEYTSHASDIVVVGESLVWVAIHLHDLQVHEGPEILHKIWVSRLAIVEDIAE